MVTQQANAISLADNPVQRIRFRGGIRTLTLDELGDFPQALAEASCVCEEIGDDAFANQAEERYDATCEELESRPEFQAAVAATAARMRARDAKAGRR